MHRITLTALFMTAWPIAGAAQVPSEQPATSALANAPLPLADVPADDVPADDVQAAQPARDLFARDTFRIDTVVCPFNNQVTYEPGTIECGLLQVPENRENLDSRFIDLLFVKISATPNDKASDDNDNDSRLAPGKRDDPVIYLTGGPGVLVTSYVTRLKEHGIIKHRDLYILEQRGIGNSGDFCRFYSQRKLEARQAETYDAYLRTLLDAVTDCADNATHAGVDLSGYSTIENARDVHALRRALQIESWNVWGISYGSTLGQAYVKQDPERIRAMALDAILPLDAGSETSYWRITKWYDRNLQTLDAACQADEDCAAHYPNLGKRVREAAQSLIDNPIVVDVKDVERFPSGKARIFEDIAALLPFALFYEQDNYPGLPAVIHAWADLLERRDEAFFKALAQVPLPIAISEGMSDAVFCLDGYVDRQAAASKADLDEFPILGQTARSVEYYQQAKKHCLDAGLARRDPNEYAPVETDIPTLIIEGAMDPITPPPLAKAILPLSDPLIVLWSNRSK